MKPIKLYVIRLTAEEVARIAEILTLYKIQKPKSVNTSPSVEFLINKLLDQASKGARK